VKKTQLEMHILYVAKKDFLEAVLTDVLSFRRMGQAISHLICCHKLMKLWRRSHLVVFWSFLPFLLMENTRINAKKVFEV
jgi:hypothetical protein